MAWIRGIELDLAAGLRRANRVEAADRHDARSAVVKFVGRHPFGPEGFGQLVGFFGGIDQSAFQTRPLVHCVDHLAGEQDVLAGERGHFDGVFAFAIEQAVLEVLVHVDDKLVESLGHEIIARQQGVGGHEGAAHRPFFGHLLVARHCRALDGMDRRQRLAGFFDFDQGVGLQVFDSLERFLADGIVHAFVIANQDGNLHDRFISLVVHLLRTAQTVDAASFDRFREIELLLIGVGILLELFAEFMRPIAAPGLRPRRR